MNLPTVVVLLAVALLIPVLVVRRWRKLKATRDSVLEAQPWYEANVVQASDPHTDPAVLRGLLAMENPYDWLFFARLAVLRTLSQNPSLPVEVHSAAINRVSSEESALRMDKSLRALAKSSGGPRGWVGVSTES